MRQSRWTPTIVPNVGDQNVYLVLDCFERSGCAWREADAGDTDLETVIRDLMAGQYNDPQRVIAFNTSEHWADDVSEDSLGRLGAGPISATKTSVPRLKTSSSATLAGNSNSL
ncbi:hypothetical protein J2W51_002333 [Tardiphaga robiniae]|uniref:hypothetical protein n=1 Tax=Tardiphaga robiniae TaxID=943830 RepID=UPI0028678BA7|nr:hypothetical protein [Tardiphaga robiniae]MDR6659763.1 hypothetical protein [Tardiphaga robiniae]